MAFLPHILAFKEATLHKEAWQCLDIGTGAGIPGLVLALAAQQDNPDIAWALCDRSVKSIDFLHWAKGVLDLDIEIIHESAELLEPVYALVTARAFAPPPVTAECISGILKLGGKAIVSTVPGNAEKHWDLEKLDALDLELELLKDPFGFAILTKKEISGARNIRASSTRSWKQMTSEPLWNIK